MSKAARDPIFTRYLYLRSDVGISLLSCILNKKTEQAVFWLMELYHSGFYSDAISILWRTYYEFYATLNPNFETHFLKKMQEVKTPEDEKNYILNMTKNLMIRPHNCDVFMLREIAANLTPEENTSEKVSLLKLLEENRYEDIIRRVIDEDESQVFSVAIDYFLGKENIIKKKKDALLTEYVKLSALFGVTEKVIVVSRIMQYYSILNKEKLKMGKGLYLTASLEEMNTHETDQTTPGEDLLAKVVKYSPNEENYLSLFYGIFGKKEQNDLLKAYKTEWLYFASVTPVWSERIRAYDGVVNDEKRKVVFENEDNEQDFYIKYGYEPDEQEAAIVENNIPTMKDRMTWVSFYEKHKNGGLYKPDSDFLEALDESTCDIL
jgi:hypothetical protein